MADEYARTGEFPRRMDERFDHADEFAEQRVKAMGQRSLDLEKRMDQGFAHAEKARKQNLVHLNQRFDGMSQNMNRRFDDVNQRFGDMNQRYDGMLAETRGVRNMMAALYGPIVVASLVAA